MTTPTSTTPSWWQTQLKSLETWGMLHWTYIAVAVVANLVGVFAHV